MKRLILALAMVLMASRVFAGEIAQCGGSAGYAYFAKFNLLASNTDVETWNEDTISDGKFSLTLSDDVEFDILFTDATGGVYSSTNDGGKVIMTGRTDNAISLLVIYLGISNETYTFFRNTDDQAR